MSKTIRLPLAPIPLILSGLALTTDQYKFFVARALKEDLPLVPISYSGFDSKVFSFSPTMRTRLEMLANEHFDGDVKAAFVALSAAGIAAEVKSMEKRNQMTKRTRVKCPFEPKSNLQAQFFEMASKCILDGQIIFAEGSTGIGKGRALCGIALMQARDEGLIVITSPTVATMEQIYAEAQTLTGASAPMAILPGASEFVDDLLLIDYLQDVETPGLEPIRQWVAGGAKPLRHERPLVKSIGPDAAWLREDLITLSESIDEFDVDAFTLRHEIQNDSLARNLVRNIRTEAGGVKILFCTHAMLALSQKIQWRIMPAPTTLIVDEAHLFEETVSMVNSNNLSLYTLRSTLSKARRENKLSAKATISIAHKKAIELSKHLNKMKYDKSIALEEMTPSERRILVDLASPLLALLSSDACSTVSMIKHYRRSLSLVVQQLQAMAYSGPTANHHDSVYVTYSNIRRFPSFVAGPTSVAIPLASIWSKAKKGVVLASATLYTPSSTGDLRCEYLRTTLNTPQGRTVMATPIIDPGIYSTPTMHIPCSATASRLRIPLEKDLRAAWYRELADILVEKVLPSSCGGTMVLCTSYADIAGIANELQTRNLDRTIVAMERGLGFSISRNAFVRAYMRGERPVFFALGPAWTGIDLSMPDLPPEEDNLLTSLVISKLPVGLNSSNTMYERFKRLGVYATTQEALLTLKQGFGRLIRRSGVQNRHIWLLDGRVYDGKPWSAGSQMTELSAATRRLIKNYQKIEEF